MPVYDGYDVPEPNEDVYINEESRKDTSPKQKKESKREKKVEPSREDSSTEQTVINRVEKEPYYLKEVIGGEVLKRRYTTIELIMGIAVISIICSSGIGVLGELPDFLAEQTVINRGEKEPYYLKEVVGGEVIKRRYTTIELIMGIAVIAII